MSSPPKKQEPKYLTISSRFISPWEFSLPIKYQADMIRDRRRAERLRGDSMYDFLVVTLMIR
jgi:hypothetical protein